MIITVSNTTYAALTEVLSKINKRAAKIGLEPITATVLTEEIVESDFYETIITLDLQGPSIKVDGWQLVAKLELTDHGNIVTAMPSHYGQELPDAFRRAAMTCDHCGTSRVRKYGYILVNAAGTYKQVGKACLADFTGHGDAASIAAMWDGILEAVNAGSKERREGEGAELLSLTGFLAHCSAMVRVGGYVSAKQAKEQASASTKDEAITNLYRKKAGTQHTALEALDYDRAEMWITLARSTFANPTNDYEHNMAVIFADNALPMNRAGFAASIIGVWYAQQEKTLKQVPTSKHVGAVGANVSADAEVVLVKELESNYGVTYLYKFLDTCGNVLVWFASRNQQIERGDKVKIAGKVKAHDSYNDQAQTILTRCKLA